MLTSQSVRCDWEQILEYAARKQVKLGNFVPTGTYETAPQPRGTLQEQHVPDTQDRSCQHVQ
jgi:hypothetical protein